MCVKGVVKCLCIAGVQLVTVTVVVCVVYISCKETSILAKPQSTQGEFQGLVRFQLSLCIHGRLILRPSFNTKIKSFK